MRNHPTDIPLGHYAVVEPVLSGPERLHTAIRHSVHERETNAWKWLLDHGAAGCCVVRHVEDGNGDPDWVIAEEGPMSHAYNA